MANRLIPLLIEAQSLRKEIVDHLNELAPDKLEDLLPDVMEDRGAHMLLTSAALETATRKLTRLMMEFYELRDATAAPPREPST